MFILTSGLRSARDKAITYFEARLARDEDQLHRLYEAANLLAEEIRRVRTEDAGWLAESGFSFDINCIIGGQMADDEDDHLYLIYPEGNWVEVVPGTPYVIIGESSYGKPLLDRAWRYEHSLAEALRDGLLSFDATRTSATDVDPPIDVVVYRHGTYRMQEHRVTERSCSRSPSTGTTRSTAPWKTRTASSNPCSRLSA